MFENYQGKEGRRKTEVFRKRRTKKPAAAGDGGREDKRTRTREGAAAKS